MPTKVKQSDPLTLALARACVKCEYDGLEYMIKDSGPDEYGIDQELDEAKLWKAATEAVEKLESVFSQGQDYLDGLTDDEYNAFCDWANEQQ